MKNVYIIRHGQTYINRFHKMQGWCDTPLTDKGIADAKRVGKVLAQVPFDIALSSDMKRASDTCDYIIQENCNRDELQHIASPFFREQFYGYFEGMDIGECWEMIGGPHGCTTRSEMLRKYSIDEVKQFTKDADPFHAAESPADYWKRVNKGFDLIRQLDGAENILLVTHGFNIRSWTDKFGGGKFDVSIPPRNGSITKMQITDKDIQITSYNQMKL